MPELHPTLLAALSAVDRGEVRTVYLGGRRIWLVSGRPDTPAIQCLIDGGWIEEKRGFQPSAVVTGKGRAVLDTLNHLEN